MQHYPHIKIFQLFLPDSIYLDFFHLPPHTHPFPNTPFDKDKRVLSFCARNNSAGSLSSLLVSMYQYFSLNNKTYPSKHTGAFEREIQLHEMVKSFCESVVVL